MVWGLRRGKPVAIPAARGWRAETEQVASFNAGANSGFIDQSTKAGKRRVQHPALLRGPARRLTWDVLERLPPRSKADVTRLLRTVLSDSPPDGLLYQVVLDPRGRRHSTSGTSQ